MKKPYLSPSKIILYLACDNKYKWTYIDSRGSWYVRAKSYYSFGTSLHNVLQNLHAKVEIQEITSEDAVQALEENWVTEGYASADEMAEAKSRGKDILTEYVANEFKRPKESKTLFVEKTFSMEFANFQLRGRMDRIEEYPDGSLEIVDYKSGRETVTTEEVHNDIAMSIYQLLLEHAYPQIPIRSTIIALRTGHHATAQLNSTEIQELRQEVELIGNEIISTNFEMRPPSAKPLCISCDFLPLCKKNKAFASDFQEIETATNLEPT